LSSCGFLYFYRFNLKFAALADVSAGRVADGAAKALHVFKLAQLAALFAKDDYWQIDDYQLRTRQHCTFDGDFVSELQSAFDHAAERANLKTHGPYAHATDAFGELVVYGLRYGGDYALDYQQLMH